MLGNTCMDSGVGAILLENIRKKKKKANVISRFSFLSFIVKNQRFTKRM